MWGHGSVFCTRIKEEFENNQKATAEITYCTYQKLESLISHNKICEEYNFIVADECHYFTSDSGFNKRTDFSFNWIMKQVNSIKIFMSATIDSFEFMLKQQTLLYNVPINRYNFPTDYSYIQKLSFYDNDCEIERIAEEVITSNKKAIFFIQSTEKALEIYNKNKENMIFSCSPHNSDFKKYMNENEISTIIEKHHFDCNILVTTSVMDSGITLIDDRINTIVVDIFNPETVIQCVGRKRIIDGKDKINLYIKNRSNRQLIGMFRKNTLHLQNALNVLADEGVYHVSNDRQNDGSEIVVNEPIQFNEFGEILYRKNFNIAKLNATQYFVNTLYPAILQVGGYANYIARWFKFYKEQTNEYRFNKISNEKKSLEEYLDSIEGCELFTKEDKKELINKFGIRDRKGKILQSIEYLQLYLKDNNIPYVIGSKRVTKTINGQRKDFKSVWVVRKI